MESKHNKAKLKNHKLGILSLIISFIPIIVVIGMVIMDIVFLTTYNENTLKNTYIGMFICLLINIIGLVIGIISLFKKGYKKDLATCGVVINLIIPSFMFLGLVYFYITQIQNLGLINNL